jgi:hypothetical protein
MSGNLDGDQGCVLELCSPSPIPRLVTHRLVSCATQAASSLSSQRQHYESMNTSRKRLFLPGPITRFHYMGSSAINEIRVDSHQP